MAGSRRNRSANTRRRENTRGRNTSLSNIKKREETKSTNQNSKIAKNTQKRRKSIKFLQKCLVVSE